jgi:hypothetical protein
MRKGSIAYASRTSDYWKLVAGTRYEIVKGFWYNGEGHYKVKDAAGEINEWPDVFFHAVTAKQDTVERTVTVGERLTVNFYEDVMVAGKVVETFENAPKVFMLEVDTYNGKPKTAGTYPKPTMFHVAEIK